MYSKEECQLIGLKHKWEHKKNVNIIKRGINSGSITLRGKYTCKKCGLTKIGNPIFSL